MAIVICLSASQAAAEIIGQERGILGGDEGFFRPRNGVVAGASVVIAALPYARTVTCGAYTLTGTAPGAGAVTWTASPSGASGSCTGTTSWSCVIDIDPDATGEGVEVITVAQSGASSAQATLGFYVDGEHSCFLSQSVDGSYNSTLANNDAVATWENLGSSALDVTQATGSAQPTFRTSIVAGQPVVSADGSDWLRGSTSSDWIFLTESNDYTVCIVFLADTYTTAVQTVVSTQAIVGSTSSRGWSAFHDNRTGSSRFDRMRSYGSNGTTRIYQLESADNGASSDKYNLISIVHDNDGGAGADAFLNGNGVLIDDDIGTNTYSSVAPTGALTLFAETDNGQPLTGDIFRVLIYQSALTSTQRSINQAVDEWALGGTLPVTP